MKLTVRKEFWERRWDKRISEELLVEVRMNRSDMKEFGEESMRMRLLLLSELYLSMNPIYSEPI